MIVSGRREALGIESESDGDYVNGSYMNSTSFSPHSLNALSSTRGLRKASSSDSSSSFHSANNNRRSLSPALRSKERTHQSISPKSSARQEFSSEEERSSVVSDKARRIDAADIRRSPLSSKPVLPTGGLHTSSESSSSLDKERNTSGALPPPPPPPVRRHEINGDVDTGPPPTPPPRQSLQQRTSSAGNHKAQRRRLYPSHSPVTVIKTRGRTPPTQTHTFFDRSPSPTGQTIASDMATDNTTLMRSPATTTKLSGSPSSRGSSRAQGTGGGGRGLEREPILRSPARARVAAPEVDYTGVSTLSAQLLRSTTGAPSSAASSRIDLFSLIGQREPQEENQERATEAVASKPRPRLSSEGKSRPHRTPTTSAARVVPSQHRKTVIRERRKAENVDVAQAPQGDRKKSRRVRKSVAGGVSVGREIKPRETHFSTGYVGSSWPRRKQSEVKVAMKKEKVLTTALEVAAARKAQATALRAKRAREEEAHRGRQAQRLIREDTKQYNRRTEAARALMLSREMAAERRRQEKAAAEARAAKLALKSGKLCSGSAQRFAQAAERRAAVEEAHTERVKEMMKKRTALLTKGAEEAALMVARAKAESERAARQARARSRSRTRVETKDMALAAEKEREELEKEWSKQAELVELRKSAALAARVRQARSPTRAARAKSADPVNRAKKVSTSTAAAGTRAPVRVTREQEKTNYYESTRPRTSLSLGRTDWNRKPVQVEDIHITSSAVKNKKETSTARKGTSTSVSGSTSPPPVPYVSAEPPPANLPHTTAVDAVMFHRTMDRMDDVLERMARVEARVNEGLGAESPTRKHQHIARSSEKYMHREEEDVQTPPTTGVKAHRRDESSHRPRHHAPHSSLHSSLNGARLPTHVPYTDIYNSRHEDREEPITESDADDKNTSDLLYKLRVPALPTGREWRHHNNKENSENIVDAGGGNMATLDSVLRRLKYDTAAAVAAFPSVSPSEKHDTLSCDDDGFKSSGLRSDLKKDEKVISVPPAAAPRTDTIESSGGTQVSSRTAGGDGGFSTYLDGVAEAIAKLREKETEVDSSSDVSSTEDRHAPTSSTGRRSSSSPNGQHRTTQYTHKRWSPTQDSLSTTSSAGTPISRGRLKFDRYGDDCSSVSSTDQLSPMTAMRKAEARLKSLRLRGAENGYANGNSSYAPSPFHSLSPRATGAEGFSEDDFSAKILEATLIGKAMTAPSAVLNPVMGEQEGSLTQDLSPGDDEYEQLSQFLSSHNGATANRCRYTLTRALKIHRKRDLGAIAVLPLVKVSSAASNQPTLSRQRQLLYFGGDLPTLGKVASAGFGNTQDTNTHNSSMLTFSTSPDIADNARPRKPGAGPPFRWRLLLALVDLGKVLAPGGEKLMEETTDRRGRPQKKFTGRVAELPAAPVYLVQYETTPI